MNEPNVIVKPDFVKHPDQLFKILMEKVVWDERMKARKTASFGVSYDYSGMTYPELPMIDTLKPICAAINELLGYTPNKCLLNYYPDGDSAMGYHSDSAEELAPNSGIAIISLGSKRSISYRGKLDKEIKYSYQLPAGALLYMTKEMQSEWTHAIPKQSGAGERISLTFRDIIKY